MNISYINNCINSLDSTAQAQNPETTHPSRAPHASTHNGMMPQSHLPAAVDQALSSPQHPRVTHASQPLHKKSYHERMAMRSDSPPKPPGGDRGRLGEPDKPPEDGWTSRNGSMSTSERSARASNSASEAGPRSFSQRGRPSTIKLSRVGTLERRLVLHAHAWHMQTCVCYSGSMECCQSLYASEPAVCGAGKGEEEEAASSTRLAGALICC